MAIKKWYQYLGEELRPLALQSLTLLQEAKGRAEPFATYDYVVFPLAKAYEPFLKSYLYRLNLITQRTYNSKKFSIGRSLNPDVRLDQRDDEWYYDDLARHCGEQVAREVWEMWLVRNQLFHLYPGEIEQVSLPQAEAMIKGFIRMIELCSAC